MTSDDPLIATGALPARVFAGLKLEAQIALKLTDLARPLKGCGARFVPMNDIHLTLVPPWNEGCIAGAIELLRTVASRFNRFLLTFEHLEYGPTLRHPRLLWARCVAGSELKELQAALMAAYGRTDTRPFQPHVTLARIPQNGRAAARMHPSIGLSHSSNAFVPSNYFNPPLKAKAATGFSFHFRLEPERLPNRGSWHNAGRSRRRLLDRERKNSTCSFN